MTVTLTDIDYGSNSWNKTVNQNLQKLNGRFTDTGWRTEGLTLVNGFTQFVGESGAVNKAMDEPAYRIYGLDGLAKIMLLKGSIVAPDSDLKTSLFMKITQEIRSYFYNNSGVQICWFGEDSYRHQLQFISVTDGIAMSTDVPFSALKSIQLNQTFIG